MSTPERTVAIDEWLNRAGHTGNGRETYRDALSQALAQFDSVAEMVHRLRAAGEWWPVYFKHSDGRYYAPADKPDLDDADMPADEKPGGRELADILDEHGEEWLEIGPNDDEPDEDKARETIQEDALSVEVRSDWRSVGGDDDGPTDYRICLCTGGPAVQIIGGLGAFEPEDARLQAQGWFIPWFDVPWSLLPDDAEETLLAYARVFYFGE